MKSLITRDLLSRVSSHPKIPRDTWYFIAGATLSTINRPDEVAKVMHYALEQSQGSENPKDVIERPLQTARRMREAMIKLAAISGLPKTINTLLELKNVTPPNLLDEPLSESPTLRSIQIHDVPSSRMLQKGQRFFDAVYGKISKRVMGQMDRSGTEDLGLTARLLYGYILSNTSVLTAAETSYVLIAGLIPQDVNPQLKGHLKGALNNGATVDEVRAVRALVLDICELYGMRALHHSDRGDFGWRTDVANV